MTTTERDPQELLKVPVRDLPTPDILLRILLLARNVEMAVERLTLQATPGAGPVLYSLGSTLMDQISDRITSQITAAEDERAFRMMDRVYAKEAVERIKDALEELRRRGDYR